MSHSSETEGLTPLLKRFDVTRPVHVADTHLATIWRATRTDGSYAALKVYKEDKMLDEALGFVLLAAWDDTCAVRLYDQTDQAVLLEWLDGPTVGDMARNGQDVKATEILGDVATCLHATAPQVTANFPRLEVEFAALMNATFTNDCPTEIKQSVLTAQATAKELLGSQTDLRPLHRDLHHDNIMGSPRGFLAFDAKGVIGERAYELANAFRNPIGAEEVFTDPFVIKRRLATWAQRFDVPADRLLSWAIAHISLSQAWSCNGTFDANIAEKDAAGCRFTVEANELLTSIQAGS